MATLNGLYFVTRAFRLCSYIDAGDTLEQEDAQEGFDILNEWMSELGNQRRAIYVVGEHPYNLQANVQSYTIGTGGTFNQERPNWIEGISIVPDKTASPVLRLPIGRPLTLEKWRALIARSSQATYPTSAYYDHAWSAGLANISVYPVPTSSNAQIILYTPDALAEFADPNTAYTFPRGYARMIRYNLAKEIALAYNLPVPPAVDQIAKESLASLKRVNWRAKDATFDPSWGLGRGRAANVVTDEA